MKTRTARQRSVPKTEPEELEGAVPVSKIKTPHSFVIYGRSGTGKTTLSCTFPGPVLLLDVNDKGTDSVSDLENVDAFQVDHWEDFETIYWFLNKNPKRYKTVIIDTVTQMQQRCIEWTLEKKRKNVKHAGDWGTMTKREWGDVAANMKSWLTDYRDLPMNVVFLAQDRTFNFGEEEDSTSELRPEVGPRLMPSVASEMNALASVIGNTFIRTKEVTKEVRGRKVKRERSEYCLRVGPNPVYVTKIRKPKKIEAPPLIVDPTYADILDIIKGV